MLVQEKSPDGGEDLSRLSHVRAVAYPMSCHGSYRKASEMSQRGNRQLVLGKTCTKCGEWKDISQFGDLEAKTPNGRRRAVDGKNYACRKCRSSESLTVYHRDPQRTRAHRLRAHYNMTQAQYDELLKSQNGVCAICSQPPTYRQLDVDHDHETGKVRGLLCNGCNGGIGLLKESPEVLRAAIAYLARTGS